MKFVKHRDFSDSVRELNRRGGSFKKAADVVDQLLGRIGRDDPDPLKSLKTTNHGETRLEYCIKYDLAGACRLVTVQKNGYCLLLFVGNHNEADAWLNSNKGTRYKADDLGRIVEVLDTIEESQRKENIGFSRIQGFLYSRLGPIWRELNVGLKRAEIKCLELLKSGEQDELNDICDDLDDVNLREAVRSVFYSLMAGQVEKAENTARDYLGRISDIDDATELVDSDKFVILDPKKQNYISEVTRLLKNEDYKRWMLFMHPEQLNVARSRFSGPAKLFGVSGSGKTCTIVRRAVELAERYEGGKVLVLTLNRPLSNLISDLMSVVAEGDNRKNIRVAPLFEICQEILKEKEPENSKIYDDTTWKSGEHVDEIWREFYRCELSFSGAECLIPVHDSLISRGIEAEKYIRQEFDWIRSAYGPAERSEYLKVERKGRKYPLSRAYRKKILDGLSAWEEKMKFVGVCDYLGLASAAYNYVEELEPEYRCVIVDESQDFGSTELAIARKLCLPNEDDILLCGDAAQQVSSKFQSVQKSGIKVHSSRIRKLEKNYRNSKDILEAAYKVLVDNISEEIIDNIEFELLDPEYADFSGSSPVVLHANSLEDEISNAIQFLRDEREGNQNFKGLVAICGYSMYEVEEYAKSNGLAALSPSVKIGEGDIFISDLEQSKGFEFDAVCIVNCNNSVLPDPRMPSEEQFRDLAMFYVAMTRAKSELVLSCSEEPSVFLKDNNFLLAGDWSEYVDKAIKVYSCPLKLDEIRDGEESVEGHEKLTGSGFLYRSEALGLPLGAIEQIRKLITGKAVVRGSGGRQERIEWADIGTALKDLTESPAARNRFGPESSSSVKDVLAGFLRS